MEAGEWVGSGSKTGSREKGVVMGWVGEAVEGEEKSGIVVRSEKALSSPIFHSHLACACFGLERGRDNVVLEVEGM